MNYKGLITKEEADNLLLAEIEPKLERLRNDMDKLNILIREGKNYLSWAQLRVLRKSKIRLQKDFNILKNRYDKIVYNK